MIAERLFSISGGWAEPHIPQKRAAILGSRLCIAVSHAAAADTVLFYPSMEDRMRTIPHGHEHLGVRTPPASLSIKNPYALFVGQRDGHKNFRVVLDAMNDPNWPSGMKLHVVGPPLNEFEQALIKALKLEGEVIGLGRIGDSDLRDQYSKASCFIYPSLLEGFGLPILEAQLSGCPAVLSDIAVFREVAGVAALFFDPRLETELAVAVSQACEDENRQEIIEAGFDNLSRYSWENAARQTLAVYLEAAERDS
jgi:glycosyltransferase involved in cell wall biosynthesis